MNRLIRYAIAAVFFAASAGCLALWGISVYQHYAVDTVMVALPPRVITAEMCEGEVVVWFEEGKQSRWEWQSYQMKGIAKAQFEQRLDEQGRFGTINPAIYFPLWYPALVFALAGVGVLRFRRQFSIRSALIGLGVVAVLLAMAVTL